MKAAVLNAFTGKFDIQNIDIAEPVGREVMVQVKASGLCHSDLHMANHNFGTKLPAVFGHELAGVVTAVGPDVREFKVGDHVAGSLVKSCGHCRPCLGGQAYRCMHQDELARPKSAPPRLSLDGKMVSQVFGIAAFAEYSLAHEQQLAKLPKEMPFPQACILGCGTVTGAGAVVNAAKIRPGETTAIIGAGGVGLNAVSGAKLSGAGRIIVIDNQPNKLALAKQFGATDVINSADGDPVAQVLALTGGGVDHAFEVVGLTVTMGQAIKMTRIGGATYLIGIHPPGVTYPVNIMADLLGPQRRLQGIFMGSSNIKIDIPMYAELYLQGKFELDKLISQTISINQINEAYEALLQGSIARSVITSF
jgi:S-(hydroxymethyl)glutathione dehydrogenase/alcohol dehydrogenase